MRRWCAIALVAACGGGRAAPLDAAPTPPVVRDAAVIDAAPRIARRWPGPCRIESRGEVQLTRDLAYDDQQRLVRERSETSVGVELETFGYDGPRLVEVRDIEDRDASIKRYRYDDHGHLIEETVQQLLLDTAKPAVADLPAAELEALVEEARPRAEPPRVIWTATYDAQGLMRVQGDHHYRYDAHGRMSVDRDSRDTSRYRYDREGRLARVDFASGGSSTFDYDDRPCRPAIEIEDGELPDPRPSGDCAIGMHVHVPPPDVSEDQRLSYDPDGDLVRTETTYAAGVAITSSTYDPAGNLLATTSVDSPDVTVETRSYDCWH